MRTRLAPILVSLCGVLAAGAVLPAVAPAAGAVAHAPAAGAVEVAAAGASTDVGAAGPVGIWVAGDLHIHTTYSHDSYGGPHDDNTGLDEGYTAGNTVTGQFAVAASRGLDFLAITDHNDVRSQTDTGFGAFGVLGLPGYENSLDGHAQMLGATTLYDNGDKSTAAVQGLADILRAGGGVFQINHPAGDTIDPAHLDWGYGYDVQPDTVEVWNISPLWQPPAPSGNSIDIALSYWDGWLDRGAHVGATGGSDNHYLATTAVQGAGQPTTWVFVEELTVPAVLEGLRQGRTTVSSQPPLYQGARIYLEADSDKDGSFDAMVGDTVPAGSDLRVRLTRAPGSTVRIFRNGGALIEEMPATSPDFVYEFAAPAGTTWVRVEVTAPDGTEVRRATCDPLVGEETSYCRDRLGLLALSSPIYFSIPSP